VRELHRLHRGQPPADAELNFLEHARRLETYGVSPHAGRDSQGRDIQLGVTSVGLVVFEGGAKINTFSWSKIVKISFKRKQFFIQLRKELTESHDTLLGFNLASYRSCKNLWRSAVEHHSFFRLHSPKPQAASATKRFQLLTLGSRFRYSGRTEFQKMSAAGVAAFPRSAPSRRTLPLEATATTSRTPSRPPRLASPETSSIGSSVHSNGRHRPPTATTVTSTGKSGLRGSQGSLGSGSSSLAHRALESFSSRVQSLSTKLPKRAWTEEGSAGPAGGTTSDDDGKD